MTRQEHLKWCRERAIQEMDYYKEPGKGLISMASDLRKHPETNKESLITLCVMTLAQNPHITRQEVIKFIDGFN
jgi:hypothetical protein